ncbi:MAG: ornithine cyclodeaminase family protein [Actinobacteria bacterium]|nr:ornithine cyclodeaminase family protein [Actinomycetota bacterium]
MTLVVLDGDQLRERLSMEGAIDALEATFGAEELPRAPERTRLAVPGGDLLLMPAVGEAGLGVKLVTIAPANPARGMPLVQAAYVLFAPDSLEPVALIDGSALTALRTAAVSGLATRHLARADAAHLVLFGAGVQAESHLEAMVAVRPIRKVTVVSRTPEPAERLAARARAMGLLGEVGRPSDVAAADVICTCTTSNEPVFEGSLLSPGTHVNAVGAFRPDARELDERTVTSGRVVVESRDAAFAEAGDLLIPAATGAFRTSEVVADLAEVVRGVRVRRNPRDITVFKSVGVAYEDLSLALAALGGASESEWDAEPVG